MFSATKFSNKYIPSKFQLNPYDGFRVVVESRTLCRYTSRCNITTEFRKINATKKEKGERKMSRLKKISNKTLRAAFTARKRNLERNKLLRN